MGGEGRRGSGGERTGRRGKEKERGKSKFNGQNSGQYWPERMASSPAHQVIEILHPSTNLPPPFSHLIF